MCGRLREWFHRTRVHSRYRVARNPSETGSAAAETGTPAVKENNKGEKRYSGLYNLERNFLREEKKGEQEAGHNSAA